MDRGLNDQANVDVDYGQPGSKRSLSKVGANRPADARNYMAAPDKRGGATRTAVVYEVRILRTRAVATPELLGLDCVGSDAWRIQEILPQDICEKGDDAQRTQQGMANSA